MECAPDWPASLRRASFRGASFFVENDSIQYGRRVKVHEFPNRDRPFVEDLGEKAIEFKVTAYVASDNALAEKDRLVRACRQGGQGTLILPTEGSLQVVPYQCDRQHSKDKLGYIAFSLSFHEAGVGFGVFTPALLARLVSVAGGGAVSSIISGFLGSFNTIGEPSWVLQSAVQTASSWVELIDDVRVRMISPGIDAGEDAADLLYQLRSTHRDVRALCVAGPGINQAVGDLTRPDVATDLPRQFAEILGGLRLAASSDEIAMEALAEIVAYDPRVYTDDEELGPSAAAERSNEVAMNAMVRRLALVEYAIAASVRTYTDRRASIQARADVAELFERELNAASGQEFAALDEVRSRAAMALSRKVTDARPLVTVEANASEPSLVWAWRLYADATRADALGDLNRVRHPAFMPATFNAEMT